MFDARPRRVITVWLLRNLPLLRASAFKKRLVLIGIVVLAFVPLVFLTAFGSRVLALATPEANRLEVHQDTADYSQFKHSNPQHARLPCLLCHRRENNSARPTLPGKSDHTPCTGCHASQFNNPNSPICNVCHTDVQAGTVKPFPPLRSFNVKFDHARHSAVGAGCATCHRQNRGGQSLSIPVRLAAHRICFGCHTPQAQLNGHNLSSCSTCHELGRLVRTSERTAAFRVGFSHVQHDASENLRCGDCHRIRAGWPRGRQVTSPLPLNHHAPARAASCMTCHNGKRAFGGDDFSTCTRCHTGSTWHF